MAFVWQLSASPGQTEINFTFSSLAVVCRLPPTHPGVILFFLVLSPFLTYWLRQNGVYYFIVMTACILLGTVMGFYVYKWTPSWAQHLLAVAMIATSIYAWQQKYYFEE